jgi:hypothetical protein
VDASLGAQPAVRGPTLHGDGHALEPGLLPFGLVDDLGVEPVPLGPAQVHPEEHLGPVGRLGAAGAGADREQRVARVVFAGEQQLRPLAVEVRGEARGLAVELCCQLGVAGLVDQLEGRLQVA